MLPSGKPGISCFVFVALLLVFNWPLLSIPAPANLFGWLFTAWGLAIALLFLVAHGARGRDAGPAEHAEPGGLVSNATGPDEPSPGPDPGASAGPDADRGAGGGGV